MADQISWDYFLETIMCFNLHIRDAVVVADEKTHHYNVFDNIYSEGKLPFATSKHDCAKPNRAIYLDPKLLARR